MGHRRPKREALKDGIHEIIIETLPNETRELLNLAKIIDMIKDHLLESSQIDNLRHRNKRDVDHFAQIIPVSFNWIQLIWMIIKFDEC